MNFILFLFRCLLALLFCYSSFVSIYISFFKNKQNDFSTWFFVLTLLLFAFISVKQIYSLTGSMNIRRAFNLHRQKTIAVFALCFISFLIGVLNVYTQYSRGVAEPELAQFNMSLSENIVEASYRQQQPPLDYYLSAFSNSLFGESKLAVRSHTVLFYMILSFTLPLGLWFFCSSFWITIIGTLLFLFNHVIRLHAVDARPLNLALLTGFIFLFFYLAGREKNQADKSFFPILASQYLFVLSIGLQPVIFIVSLFISSLWLLFDNQKTLFKNLFLSNIITGLLALPFYIKMWAFGRSAYKFKSASSESIGSYLENLNITYLIEKYFFIFYKQMSLSFSLLIISLMVIWCLKKTTERKLLILLSSLILFPVLYDPLFNINIIWNGLHNWYIITFSLFLIMFSVLSLKEIKEYLSKKIWRTFFLPLFSFLFLLNMYFQISAIKNKTQFRYPYQDNSVKKVYDFLKENGDSKDAVIEFSLLPVVFYRPDEINFRKMLFHNPETHPVIFNFYVEFAKTPPFFHENTHDRIYYVDWKNIREKQTKIFFIVLKDNRDNAAYGALSSFMEGHKVGRYVIFQKTVSGPNKEMEYKQFLSKANHTTPKKYRGVLYETLLYYAHKNRNKIKFNRLLEEYREMETALDEFTPDFNYPSRFELRRRVKYFEKLDWSMEQ